MARITIDQIETLSQLYKLKKIDPAGHEPVQGATSAHNDRIGVFRGDITTLAVDSIVNAANESLLGGGGVDGAIHRAAGDDLYDECKTLGGCATGQAKITNAYRLPCKKVIHTVGPIYRQRKSAECQSDLASCYKSSLKLAVENSMKSVAFPAISTGIYGYPSAEAAAVACSTVKEFLDGDDGNSLETVIFVLFERKDVASYDDALPQFFPAETTDTDEKLEADAQEMASKLPDAPKTDPADSEHAHKKQKGEQE